MYSTFCHIVLFLLATHHFILKSFAFLVDIFVFVRFAMYMILARFYVFIDKTKEKKQKNKEAVFLDLEMYFPVT